MDSPEHTSTPRLTAASGDPPDDEPLGGEPPCWAHLLDDEGRLPEAGASVPRPE